MYTSVVTSLFDLIWVDSEQFSQTMPELMSAFGMTSPGSTLIEFYHLIYTALFISSSHSFLKSLLRIVGCPHVDRGSMATIIHTRESKNHYYDTNFGSVDNFSCFNLLMTLAQIIVSHLMFPGDLDVLV